MEYCWLVLWKWNKPNSLPHRSINFPQSKLQYLFYTLRITSLEQFAMTLCVLIIHKMLIAFGVEPLRYSLVIKFTIGKTTVNTWYNQHSKLKEYIVAWIQNTSPSASLNFRSKWKVHVKCIFIRSAELVFFQRSQS